MKIMIRTLLGLAILAAVPCFAATNDIGESGFNYLRACRNAVDIANTTDQATMCIYYTEGVLEGVMMAEDVANANDYSLSSASGNVTVGQLLLMTVHYLDTHPVAMNLPTRLAMFAAVREAYPPAPGPYQPPPILQKAFPQAFPPQPARQK